MYRTNLFFFKLLKLECQPRYIFNYEELMHAHFKEEKLYENTILVDRKNFEWGYFRKNKIERL